MLAIPFANAFVAALAPDLWGRPWAAWGSAAGLALGVFLALLGLRALASRRLARHAARTQTGLDDLAVDLLKRLRLLPIAALAIAIGAFPLDLPPRWAEGLRGVAIVLLVYQLAVLGAAAVDWKVAERRRRAGDDPTLASSLGVLQVLAKLAIGTVLVLVALDNLGVNVTALVAGLGIGGVAIALAVQNILADLFASFTILLDKPFAVGDVLAVDALTGTVESIGLKTTRLRSQTGEELIFGNGDLLKSRLRNLKRMTERRVTLPLRLAVDTPVERVAAFCASARAAISAHEDLRFDRAHLAGIAPAGLEVEVVYVVSSPEAALHLDRRHAVLLALLEEVERLGIALATVESSRDLTRAERTLASGAEPSPP